MALWSFHKSVEGANAVLTTSLVRVKARAASEGDFGTAGSGLSTCSSKISRMRSAAEGVGGSDGALEAGSGMRISLLDVGKVVGADGEIGN